MGYNMHMANSEFFIVKENIPNVVKAIKDLLSKGREFGWVDSKNIKSTNDVSKIFMEWCYEVEFDAEMNINRIWFIGEKLGDEIEMFKVIAPWVKAGSFIEMVGEDGSRWRWMFDGKTVKEKNAKVVWD